MKLTTPDPQFSVLAQAPDNDLNLAALALRIAARSCPELDDSRYLGILDDYAEAVERDLAGQSSPCVIATAIGNHLFNQLGFRGNDEDFYDPRNSFLNEVIDRRLGIPITLSVIFLEVAWRLGLSMSGISFPGKFLVGHFEGQEPLIIDPFAGGTHLERAQIERFLMEMTATDSIAPETLSRYLIPASKREIVSRILRNLKSIYISENAFETALDCIEHLIVVDPGVATEIRDRGFVLHQLDCFHAARADLLTYLERNPGAEDASAIEQLLATTAYAKQRLN